MRSNSPCTCVCARFKFYPPFAMKIIDQITIKEDSRIPKYRQIVDAIIENISAGTLKIDDKIPSINALSEHYLLSRDTVEKALQYPERP